MFKIGKLIGKSGLISWRSFRDDDRLMMTSSDINSIATSTFSKAMVNSVAKKDLSVLTPSITSRTASQTPKSMKIFNMASANPQPGTASRYKGARDLSYSQKVDPEYDMLKFGKKTNMERKPTSEQVLEAHLKQIGNNKEIAKRTYEMKKKQEQVFLGKMKELEVKDRQRYEAGRKAIQSDLNRINQKILDENNNRK